MILMLYLSSNLSSCYNSPNKVYELVSEIDLVATSALNGLSFLCQQTSHCMYMLVAMGIDTEVANKNPPVTSFICSNLPVKHFTEATLQL